MEPYVIRRGDYLLSLSHRFGFDADTIWNDPKNAKLQQLRPDQNLLCPGDILYIPNQNAPPVMRDLPVGTTTTFISEAPSVLMTHQFIGTDETTYASKAYTVQELESLTGLETDASGVATFPIPVTLARATVQFTDTGESCTPSSSARSDPIDTPTGDLLQR